LREGLEWQLRERRVDREMGVERERGVVLNGAVGRVVDNTRFAGLTLLYVVPGPLPHCGHPTRF
jgi:hypothetical protein